MLGIISFIRLLTILIDYYAYYKAGPVLDLGIIIPNKMQPCLCVKSTMEGQTSISNILAHMNSENYREITLFFSFSLIFFSRFSIIIMYYLLNKNKQVYALKYL